MKPVGDRVLVRRVYKPEKSGSIYIPERARQFTQLAIVLAVGSGYFVDHPDGTRTRHPIEDVKVGDRILIRKRSEVYVRTKDGEDQFFVRYENIIGVIDHLDDPTRIRGEVDP